ncbi:MAG: oxidoreductase [Acidobacteria bacterium]|nr:MAG: oxidoreductase [Acidobacteriota bacterium]
MIRIGIIGYGYWGPNLVRNFVDAPGATVGTVCDLNAGRLERAAARYPGINTTTTAGDVIGDPRIDAIAIATPVSTHFDFAKRALAAGKHVLVEKPLTSTADEGRRLIDEAARRGRVLMVDHTFVYTGAVRKVRELVAGGNLGDIYYFDSVRVNLGLFQHDVSVIWDLAVHDLSIMDYVIPSRPTRVSATGMSHVGRGPENVAYLTLFFADTLIAHIHVNWLAPVKMRRMLIGGSRKMIVYDDIEPSEKVKVYDSGISVTDPTPDGVYKMMVSYRTGDVWAPRLDQTEALQTEALHFVKCIGGTERPITDGDAGLRVVRIMEAATRSMNGQGRPVELDLA